MIDNTIWGQHTVAEARYDGSNVGVHVRIPANVVIEARDLFSPEDLPNFDPHIIVEEQPYQFHIFNASNHDTYINDVPFDKVKQLLWYLHKEEELRNDLISQNATIEFSDFARKHPQLENKPGIMWLHYGHEKYGFFDLIQPGTFLYKQIHRAALYGAFLKAQKHRFQDSDIRDALPHKIRKHMNNGVSLEEAVLKSLINGGGNHTNPNQEKYTIYSTLEAFSLVFDGASSRQDYGNLRVCKEHENPIYWSDYGDRLIYRMVNPFDDNANVIINKLNGVKEEACPICEKPNQPA